MWPRNDGRAAMKYYVGLDVSHADIRRITLADARPIARQRFAQVELGSTLLRANSSQGRS